MRLTSRVVCGLADVCGLAMVLLSFTTPVLAHHGFAAEFDRSNVVTLKGQVTKMEFENPHVYIYVDVKSDDGKVVNWAFEGTTPNALIRQGWHKDTVKAGDTVTIKGYRARDGSNLAYFAAINFTDGRPSPTDKLPPP
jgi:hypothetical protein